MTLTYKLNLARVKVNLHTTYQGHRTHGSGVRVFTDVRTDRRTDGHYQVLSYAVDQNKIDQKVAEKKMQLDVGNEPYLSQQ